MTIAGKYSESAGTGAIADMRRQLAQCGAPCPDNELERLPRAVATAIREGDVEESILRAGMRSRGAERWSQQGQHWWQDGDTAGD